MATNIGQKQHHKSLAEWTQILCEQDMPIFSNTATDIYQSLDDSIKGAMELASVILQDPNLTAILLKISNSSYYNPSHQKISTVSRAIVILGANTIRELTLACAFFESVLPAANKTKAHLEIAQAIHAAAQAREIAIMLQDPSPEEVFIAALLHTIGNISFWCFAGQEGEQIQKLLATGHTQEQAEKQVLGFSLSRLSKSLTRAWHLKGLIEEAITSPNSDNQRIRTIQISHAISQASLQGKDSPELKECLTQLAQLTGQDNVATKAYFNKCKAKAADIAAKFGAHQASELINPATEQEKQTAADSIDLKPNCKQIQFQLLQEITDHISGSINLNVLLELVLEGIHRGLNMDRTVFLLLSGDKKLLKEKFFLGKHSQTDHKLEIPLAGPANIFSECLNIHDSIWAKPETHQHLFSRHIQETLECKECFVMPVTTERKVIGIIYCDRYQQKLEFSEEDFKTSKHFARQADIGLTLYRMRNN